MAVHRGDERFPKPQLGKVDEANVETSLGCGFRRTEQRLGVWRGGCRRLLQVGAGAERPFPGPGEDCDSDIVPLPHLYQMGTQRFQRVGVKRVECFGSIQRDSCDLLMNLESDRHCYLSAENVFNSIHIALSI